MSPLAIPLCSLDHPGAAGAISSATRYRLCRFYIVVQVQSEICVNSGTECENASLNALHAKIVIYSDTDASARPLHA